MHAVEKFRNRLRRDGLVWENVRLIRSIPERVIFVERREGPDDALRLVGKYKPDRFSLIHGFDQLMPESLSAILDSPSVR
jgi:hypothetical protein